VGQQSLKTLNELLLFSIKKEILNKINYDNLINNFALKKFEKINFE